MSPPPARRIRSLVALASERLAATRGGRGARLSGVLAAVGFSIAALALRGDADASDGTTAGILAAAAEVLVVCAATPVALAAAADRAATDRDDGIEALAAARGVSIAGLESARVLGAMVATARALGIPVVTVGVASVLFGGRPSVHGVGLVAGALGFSLVAGAALGSLGAICARIGRRRGPSLWLSLVIAPWALADLAGHSSFSIPGALHALLTFMVPS